MEAKERRASPRKPIRLPAQLRLADDHSLPCQIADFCAEGLFIRFSSDTGRRISQIIAERNQHDFVVMFRSSQDEKCHNLHVRKARLIDGAMGVTFTRSNTTALNAMVEVCGASEQERKHLKAPSERVQFVLHQCARAVIQHIEPLMSTAMGHMGSELENAARQAGSDQLANELMDSAALLTSREHAIWHQMVQALESPLKPERKGAPGSELSLVDKSEFEDWLTLKVMVTKADTIYRGELLQLRMRLDKLGVSNATGHQNPLGPALVTEAFHIALQHIRLTRESEKVCLRNFEKDVLQSLGPLYEELNRILVRRGILPDLDLSRYLSDHNRQPETEKKPEPKPAKPAEAAALTAKKPRPEPQSPKKAASESDTAPTSPEAFRQSSTMAQTAFTTVKSLLATLTENRNSRNVASPATLPPDARALSAGELQRELQSLQQSPISGQPSDLPLRERVVRRLKSSTDARLTKGHHEALDVVDQFFCSIADSPRLNEHTRAQMHHLEVPVLKVVLRDREFFDDADSPVRGVINRLAQLGVRGGRANPVLQKRVESVVQQINQDFEQDPRVFTSAGIELDKLIERQNTVYRRNVERVTAAAEGAQKVTQAKEIVSEALARRLDGRRIPKAVVTLLDGGWRDLLSLTWIRQGADSDLWREYLSVLDSLMAYAHDPSAPLNLRDLLRIIQEGLASISSNHMPSSHIRNELKQFLTNRKATIEWVDMPASRPDDEIGQSPQRHEKSSLQRWISRAQKLQTGDWVRNQENPDQPLYIRLVWIAREFSRFVFVNHQGMRVVELTLEALADRLKRGILIPDSQYERPLMDESIDRMVRQVYDQLSWASSHDDLTGLLARREFERMLAQYLAQPGETQVSELQASEPEPREKQTSESHPSLVLLDLRQFRLLNDAAGHRAGDDALHRVAGMLREQLDNSVPVARLDGNEFAFLVPAATANAKVKQIIAAIEAIEFKFGGGSYQLSACAGIAPVLPALVTAERWLRAAGEACHRAREQGNGGVTTYSLDARAQAHQEQIAARISGLGSLRDDQMLLRCQKIIPLHTEAIMSAQYEVLISMYDDSGNLITTSEFVRMAERYNRMQAVDRWVVGHMLDRLRDADSNAAAWGGVCINLSGFSLNDASLLEFIYEKLGEKDAPIERLWFEITEASAINNLQEVAEFMVELKELGCRFCLGNFGSGPRSIEYMRSLPVDLIKLDGAFIRHVATSETDRAVVRSMVDMAHYTRREVIASEVEDRETLDTLRTLGLDYAQGYAIERPQLLDTVLGTR